MFVPKRRRSAVRVLFVQQDHASPVGPIGERFAEHGYDVEELLVVPADRFHDPGVDVEFPDPTHYDVIVPMGAAWSVYDAETIAWVKDELAFLRTAHEAGVSVLGICFGGQALAAALGGSVLPAPEREVGWYVVDTDEPGLVEPGPWFEWHHDRWTPPPGARTIARTGVADQAFVIGRSLAVQFHPELTAAMLVGWLENGGTAYLEAHGLEPEEMIARTDEEEAQAAARGRRLVDRFLAQVATSPDLVATCGTSP
jgi:GMP synthase-like glutamine amidotransferase